MLLVKKVHIIVELVCLFLSKSGSPQLTLKKSMRQITTELLSSKTKIERVLKDDFGV